jgi:hypothetical protein
VFNRTSFIYRDKKVVGVFVRFSWEFIGSLIVIPIAAGYLGLDWVIQNAGLEWLFKQCLCLNNGVLL